MKVDPVLIAASRNGSAQVQWRKDTSIIDS
jgi:hypothetical protein